MSRPDPAIVFLKDLGFLPVRLPRADIRPLQVVEKTGKDLNLLGDLQSVMVAGSVPLPQVVSDIQTANQVQGQRSSRVKLTVGLNILGNIIRSFTGQNLDLALAYQNAKTLTFEFADVTVERCQIVQLDQFLNRADISPDSRHVEDLMIDDKVGVITATLRSRKYLVAAQGEGGVDLAVNVPVIQGAVGGAVQVVATNTSNTQVAYEGPTPLTFGVQAVRLFFDDDGSYTAFNPFQAGEAAVRSIGLAAASTPELLEVEGAFARIGSSAAATGGR